MTMDASSGGTTDQPARPAPIELHWMQPSDITMHTNAGVAVPALCGAWMQPDEALAEQLVAGVADEEYVSCVECDLLYSLRMDPQTNSLLA